jgi:hypothetical protein
MQDLMKTFGSIQSEWHESCNVIESELSPIGDIAFLFRKVSFYDLASLPLLWGHEGIRESKEAESEQKIVLIYDLTPTSAGF